MRNVLFVLVAGASACAARAPQSTFHAEYSCGDTAAVRDGTEIRSPSHDAPSRLSWSDTAGDHYVSWPVSPTDRSAIEFVVPVDPNQDAVQHTYDTTFGSSTTDWRLVSKKTCTVRGGYNDALARYMRGESIDEMTQEMGTGDRDETRARIRKALTAVERRYSRER